MRKSRLQTTNVTADLFADLPDPRPAVEPIADDAVLLSGFVKHCDAELLRELNAILSAAPLRSMITPGGRRMSVTTSSCGTAGWVSDSDGYRYSPIDPETQRLWPSMPALFLDIARSASTKGGFDNFVPDSCLINCYKGGARMSLHQDRNEQDCHMANASPIVSVSLGLPAVFLFGGMQRSDRPSRHQLIHGDVVVWGGTARLKFHGIAPLADGYHPLLGNRRINLTFRKAL